MGTTQDSTTGTKEVQTQVTAVTDLSLLAQKHENALIFSAGAPRRRGTPLLQFWHHEVTDCSAKTSVPKFSRVLAPCPPAADIGAGRGVRGCAFVFYGKRHPLLRFGFARFGEKQTGR